MMLRDLAIALVFLTRLPLRPNGPVGMGDLASVVHWFPVVGVLVGVAGGAAFTLAHFLHLPSWPAAVLALGAMLLLTGALHEDGLADTADALGALPDQARALAVMRDSRIGSFGTLALILVVGGRLGALAGFWEPLRAIAALVAAAAFSRALMPLVMWAQPSARSQGLAATAGRPPTDRVLIGLAIGATLTILILPTGQGLGAMLAAALVAAFTAKALGRAFGGCTGDTLGAVQQLTEMAFLFALVIWR
jgi:adenosylcobinamide-GDP ribazoletransferase